MELTEETGDFEKWLQALPRVLSPTIYLSSPNETITIFKGVFELRIGQRLVRIDGEIYFTWSPDSGLRFKGEPQQAIFLEIIDQITVDGWVIQHGYCFITRLNGDGIVGCINSPFVVTHAPEKTDTIYFELPNFRDFLGSPVNANDWMKRDRLTFENKDWSVIIDKVPDYDRIKNELSDTGGYALLFTGALHHKKGKVGQQQMQAMVKPLGIFLSFLNGRRCYPCFLQGQGAQGITWTDYSASYADRYKAVDSWLPQEDFSGINQIWDTFLSLATDAGSLECIDYLMHWYFEANNNSGFSEGAIVLLQNAFELLFNWQLVEQLKMYTPKQGKETPAADKIRVLLNDAGIPLELPAKYKRIENELHAQKIPFQDFPQLFTLIRNSITHANLHKRLSLAKIPSLARHHVKDIGICYLELLLLKLFNYQGKYASRISENMFRGGNEELVPWTKTKQLS
jgi:hypothetical protein